MRLGIEPGLMPGTITNMPLVGACGGGIPFSLVSVTFQQSVTVNRVCQASGGLRSLESLVPESDAFGLGLQCVVLLSI